MSIQGSKLVNLSDAQLLYDDLRDRTTNIGTELCDLKSAIDDLVEGVAILAYGNPESSTPGVTPGFMTNAGVTGTGDYTYTDKIAVVPGDRVVGYKKGNVFPFRYVTAYAGTEIVSAKGKGSTVYEYIVPDGINDIRVTTYIEDPEDDELTITIEHKVYVNNLLDDTNAIRSNMQRLGSDYNLFHLSELVRNKSYVTSESITTSYSYFKVSVVNGTSYTFSCAVRCISRTGQAITQNLNPYDTYTATANETLFITVYNSDESIWGMCKSTDNIDLVGNPKTADITDLAYERHIVPINGQITDIKSQLGTSPNLYNLAEQVDGVLNTTTGAITPNDDYVTSGFIPVVPGKTYYFSTNGAAINARVYVEFYAQTGAVKVAYSGQNQASVTIHSGVHFLRISVPSSTSKVQVEKDGITAYSPYNHSKRIDNLEALSDEFDSRIDALEENQGQRVGSIVKQVSFTATLGAMSTAGVIDSTATDYAYTNKITVKAGDTIRTIPIKKGARMTMYTVTAFNGETAVSASGANNALEYIVPSGIDGVVVTGYVAESGDASSIPYIFRFTYGVENREHDSNGSFERRSTFGDGDQITLPLNNVSKNVVWAFDGVVTSFSALDFGRTGKLNKIRVSSTTVSVYDENGDVVGTPVEHGITIANMVSVRIEHSLSVGNGVLTITVSSNGVKSSPITISWSVNRSGKPYVKSVESTITDCTFSFSFKDINKRLWVFGDSSCSIGDSRWMGQLKNAGYIDNILLNAYPGESASENIPSLFTLIDKGNADAILWVNGGNDGTDEATYPNSVWTSAIQIFITACESRGIIPILATVPTMPNHGNTINCEQKNKWVRESGKRYVDMAMAIGRIVNGTYVWYNGFLSSDEVHPTELGAIALFNRAITDCPELTES